MDFDFIFIFSAGFRIHIYIAYLSFFMQRLEEVAKHDATLLQKSSLNIPLLPESAQDRKIAELMHFQTVKSMKFF